MATKLRLAHLYPKLMNIYGDRGNILCLARRCQERKIAFELTELTLGEKLRPKEFDIVFIGGAQDREQRAVAEDLVGVKGDALREAVGKGVVVLAVCGGYQLMGRYYRGAEGEQLPGVGLLGLRTEHPGAGSRRLIGNVVLEWHESAIVGFENHGGRTYLEEGTQPLGRVVSGYGNNGEDGTEGAVSGTAYGTYLHGSLLPKNPHFADHLIETALRRRNKGIKLPTLDDRVEKLAHAAAVRQATHRGIISV